jgi:FMN reductase
MTLKIVIVNGSLRTPSRTGLLLSALSAALTTRVQGDVHSIHLAQDAPAIFSALTRETLSPDGHALIETVEAADLLLVGTSVYRASYTGALKHLFDLVQRQALVGKVGVLVASGGSPAHSLMIEHQLRPLLGFFNVFTAPTGLYASDLDFTEGALSNPLLASRIERAADEAVRLLQGAGRLPQ